MCYINCSVYKCTKKSIPVTMLTIMQVLELPGAHFPQTGPCPEERALEPRGQGSGNTALAPVRVLLQRGRRIEFMIYYDCWNL